MVTLRDDHNQPCAPGKIKLQQHIEDLAAAAAAVAVAAATAAAETATDADHVV